MDKVVLCALCLLCIFIGWALRGVSEVKSKDTTLYKGMSWGYDESEDNWNRIRVDEKGNVICSEKK